MRVLICGSRSLTVRWVPIIRERLLLYLPTEVIQGGQVGADAIAASEARGMGILVRDFPANWLRYGNAAGPIRNQQMLDEGKPEEVWAFHTDPELGKGTRDMVQRARKAGIVVRKHIEAEK